MTFLADLATAMAIGAQDRAAGRAQFAELWAALPENDHAGRCILAHYIADLQDDLGEEVGWDEVALTNSQGVTDSDLQALHPSLTVLGFVPSLQLNLADGYRRQGRFEEAATALAASIAQNASLPVDLPQQVAYRDLILSAQARTRERIEARDSASTGL
jgi:hypothetical protein